MIILGFTVNRHWGGVTHPKSNVRIVSKVLCGSSARSPLAAMFSRCAKSRDIQNFKTGDIPCVEIILCPDQTKTGECPTLVGWSKISLSLIESRGDKSRGGHEFE
jgi:hypothetical protein